MQLHTTGVAGPPDAIRTRIPQGAHDYCRGVSLILTFVRTRVSDVGGVVGLCMGMCVPHGWYGWYVGSGI